MLLTSKTHNINFWSKMNYINQALLTYFYATKNIMIKKTLFQWYKLAYQI